MFLTDLPVTYGVDPWSSETVQQLPLGTLAFDLYGNAYRYVLQNASAAGVSGDLYQRPAIDTAFVDLAVAAAAPLITTGTAKTPNKQVTVTNGATATTAGMFDGGRAVVSVTPGIGQQFTVANTPVALGAASLVLTFEEPLAVALTTSSKITLIPNGFKNIVINPTTFTGNPAGVMIAPLAVSTYGWVGVHGVFGVLSDATTAAVGFGISPSTTTAGCITKAVTLKDSIGYVIVATVSAQVEPEWININ